MGAACVARVGATSAHAGVGCGKAGEPVDLYEYQAKDLFAAHGVPVLPGRTVETPEEAAAHLASEQKKWGRVIKQRGIKAE